MAAHGYIPLCQSYLSQIKTPSVIEVGVDTGVMFLTLMNWLIRFKPQFSLIGVDVKVQDSVALMVNYAARQSTQQVHLMQNNSLDVLPRLVDERVTFDLMLIDGDHNYHTVSQELKLVNQLTHPHSVVIVDDYDGRWATRDLWYAERPDYETCDLASKRIETEKHGVRPAVDEFLESNPSWKLHKPILGEPVLLTRADVKFTNT